MKGWEKEIIEPFNEIIAPKKLVWKEKWGVLRCEWLLAPSGELESVGPMGTVLEEASRLCCGTCGRWHGWIRDNDKEAAAVKLTDTPWILNLCQWCTKEYENEAVRRLQASQGAGVQETDRD